MKLNLTKKTNKGFTLVEILLVVGFIALAGLGVYVVYSKVQEGQFANREGRNLDIIRSSVKSLYASKTSYVGIRNDILINAKVAPDEMIQAGVLKNIFDGDVTVAAGPQYAANIISTAAVAAGKSFTIQTNTVPTAICAKLSTAAGANFDQIQIAGVNIKEFTVNPAGEINVGTMSTQCGTGPTVDMVFISK